MILPQTAQQQADVQSDHIEAAVGSIWNAAVQIESRLAGLLDRALVQPACGSLGWRFLEQTR
jgi:hypothetical protein